MFDSHYVSYCSVASAFFLSLALAAPSQFALKLLPIVSAASTCLPHLPVQPDDMEMREFI